MSERTVYAIASGKGGVGKTTTAINLGAMLAERDHSVVVVDTDLGMANLADFLDFETGTPTLHEVLAGDADFESAIDRAPGGIDVLPSATDIEAFTRSDPQNLQSVVTPLREEYDYVLLDTGAGVSYDTLVPLALADAVLLVATPDVASVRDTAKTGELAERVESEVTGAVVTQRSSDILNADDVEETLGTDVLAVVPQDEAVPMGIDAGRPLAAFAPNAPAGQAYRELAAVVTGAADPDPELELGSGPDENGVERDDPDEDAGLGADAVTGSELAENVRDAIEDDQSEGLLGGELATVADEIREQAEQNAAKSSSNSPGDHGTKTADDEDAIGDDVTTAPADESEARSVDDLINEHINDERLSGGDAPGGDAPGGDAPDGDDDPLAGLDDDRSDANGESEDFFDAGDEASASPGDADDELGDADESFTDDVDLDSDEPNETSNRAEAADAERRNENSERGAVPFDKDSDGADAESEPESDSESESKSNSGSESSDAEANGVKTGTLSDDDDSGILSRLGSLFR